MERIDRVIGLAHPLRAAAAAAGGTQSLPEPAAALPIPAEVARSTPTSARAHVAPLDREALHERRVILPDDDGPPAHAYRMLRAQLLRQVRASKHKVIGVISAADGEGKTLTAVNLALSLSAEPNQNVLLLDLDLRKPGVAELLWLGSERGIDSWFTDEAPLEELFVRIEGVERLRVLPALQPVPRSSDVLAGTRTKELLTELRGRYNDRLIIVDLPPVLLADDFLTVAPHLDCVLLVLSEGRSRRDDVRRMKELLGGVRILGSVLNVSGESERRAY